MKKNLLIALFIPALTFGALPEKSATPPLGPQPSNTIDIVVDAEFLYWHSNVSETYYAIEKEFVSTNNDVTPQQGFLISKRKEELDWSWDCGSRIGLGITTNYDGWDLYSTWTYLFTSGNNSKTVDPFFDESFNNINVNSLGSKTLSSPWFLDPDGEHYNYIHAKLTLLFNQIDLELGRAFWLGKFLAARPFFGLRGFWTTMNYYVKGNRPVGSNITFLQENTQNRQKRWGVGILTGLNTAWYLSKNWSIFGNGSAALTYGKVAERKKMFFLEVDHTDQIVAQIQNRLTDNFYDIQPIIDLSAGLRFETTFNDSIRLQIDGGYEFHYLHDFNKLITGGQSRPHNTNYQQPSAEGDLTLSGFVARFRLDY